MLNKVWTIVRKTATSIAGIGCLVIGFCLVAQIFCRTFLGIALSWSEEIAQCGMIFMVFLALAEVEWGNEHLQVEILFTALPKLAKPMTIVGKVLTLVYGAIIAYSGFLMLPSVQKTLAKASRFPIRFLYYAMIIGVILWMIQAAINLAKTIQERGDHA